MCVAIASRRDGKPWVCVEYNSSNATVKADIWQIQMIEEILDYLGDLEYFSKLYLFRSSCHILTFECCREKTNLLTIYGIYEFLVVPLELMIAIDISEDDW